MSQISLTAPMRSNLLALQNIARQQDIVQNRLATGLKVSSAIDNPSSYYTAASLSNRAADLSALLDAMSQGVQTIKTASEAISSATKFLEQAKATANQALSEQSGQPVIAHVSTEEELLAAIASDEKGLIVLEKDITMSENQSINLQDGQSLVGAEYITGGTKKTSLNFSFVDQAADMITVGENSILANLDINVSTNKRADGTNHGVIFVADDIQNIYLKNINVSLNTETDTTTPNNEWLFAITCKTEQSNVNISGVVNLIVEGSINDTALSGNNKYTGGIARGNINVDGILNIHTNAVRGDGFNGSTINASGNSQINVQTHGYYANGIAYVTANLHDNASLNLYIEGQNSAPIAGASSHRSELYLNDASQMNGYYKQGVGFAIATDITLNSSKSKINIWSETSSDIFYDNYISAVSGAEINTNYGSFTCQTDTEKLYVHRNVPPATNFITRTALTDVPQNINFH